MQGDKYYFIAGATASALASLGSWMMPLITGTLIEDLDYSETSTGLVISIEMLSMAVGAFLTATLLVRIAIRHLVVIGAVFTVVGHLASAYATSHETMLFCRMVTGFGEGILSASGVVILAKMSDSDRGYALSFIVTGIIAAFLLAFLPPKIEAYQSGGLFISLSVICLILAPGLFLAPKKSEDSTELAVNSVASVKSVSKLKGILFIFGLLSISIMEFSMWANIERLGVNIGIDREAIGYILSAATLIGLLGAGLAAFVSTRFGRIAPLVIAISLQAIFSYLCIFSTSPDVYKFSQAGWSLCLYFAYPYLLGMAASLDSTGRWVAAGNGMLLTGQIIAPILSGLIVEFDGYRGLFALIALLTPLSLISFYHANKFSNRASEKTYQAP